MIPASTHYRYRIIAVWRVFCLSVFSSLGKQKQTPRQWMQTSGSLIKRQCLHGTADTQAETQVFCILDFQAGGNRRAAQVWHSDRRP